MPGTTAVPGGPSSASVASARAALACDPLRAYLTAITGAPDARRGPLANIGDSLGFTTMHFSADPTMAAAQLCGPRGGRS